MLDARISPILRHKVSRTLATLDLYRYTTQSGVLECLTKAQVGASELVHVSAINDYCCEVHQSRVDSRAAVRASSIA